MRWREIKIHLINEIYSIKKEIRKKIFETTHNMNQAVGTHHLRFG